jgi:tripartite ATP-independent transporter DctP family solute receptor
MRSLLSSIMPGARTLSVSAGIFAAFVATAPLTQPAAAQTIIKLAHTEGEGDLVKAPYWAWTETFGRLVESGTNGRYKVQVFPNKQLGDLESIGQQTARGIIQMSAGLSAGNLSSYFPSIQVLEMPYTFPSTEIGRKVMNGKFGHELADAVAQQSGIRILAFLPSAFRNFSTAKKPIHSPEDMKGLKIRVQPIPIHLEMVKALGASPTPIAWAELYNALQTGVVDGQENAPYTMLLANLQEVQKFYVLDNHILNMPLITMNEKFYQGLAPADRKVIDYAAREASFAMLGIIAAKEAQDLKAIAAAGVTIYQPTPAEFQKFVEATREPILKIMREKVDPKWIDKLYAAIAEAKKEVGE